MSPDMTTQTSPPEPNPNDNRTRYALVGCGSKKKSGIRSELAKCLYTSNYFVLKRNFAEEVCDSWVILSAKFGPISPIAYLPPYDITISDYPLEDRNTDYTTIDEWADDIIESMDSTFQYFRDHDSHEPLDEIYVLAGVDYREPILDDLRELADSYGADVISPFEHTSGIGEQMSWLKTQTQKFENA